MIISASRRTDIPAFYGEWFMNRLRAGEVLVRNPMNRKQVSSIPLSRDVVDAIVFWTKDPGPFLSYIPELKEMGYPFYFTITINPYDRSLEGNVPLKKSILQSVESLVNEIGKERVVWRYDPIAFTEQWDFSYHVKWFYYLSDRMADLTEKCVFSFLRDYGKISGKLKKRGIIFPGETEKRELVRTFKSIVDIKGISLASCSLPEDYDDFGIIHNKCIDPELIEKICEYAIESRKDKSQRFECGCVESRDIGTYNTCLHDCLYCYANSHNATTAARAASYDPHSPMLCDSPEPDDMITPARNCKSLAKKFNQGSLF